MGANETAVTLLPCPFCGGGAALKRTNGHCDSDARHVVECLNCTARVEYFSSDRDMLSLEHGMVLAHKSWNERAN